MTDPIVDRLRQAVDAALPAADPALLAVSGGIDSMVLLDAAIAVRAASAIRAATFDHASGDHSAIAADFVERVALAAGVSITVGRSEPLDRPTEARWREARLAFLRAAAAESRAILCTAHTRDDQIETVLFRELRGAGARGLAGLRASGTIRRPLLGFGRADVERYARAAGVQWVEDPTNANRSFARNRLRHELLPALRSGTPGLEAALVDIGERASRWRAEVDEAVDARIDHTADREAGTLDVAASSLGVYDDGVLAILWPALLARIGVAADWRGTRRLVEFTRKGTTSQRIQLSGGWVVSRRRNGFEVRRHEGTSERHSGGALPFRSEHDRTL